MNRSIQNPFLVPLRNDEPEQFGGGPSDGLSGALAKAAAEGGLVLGGEASESPRQEGSQAAREDEQRQEEQRQKPEEKAPEKDKPKPAATEEEEVEEEEFPEIGSSKKDAEDQPDKDAFDEKKFDEETEASAKDMPEAAKKKFKELRTELKTFRQAPPAAAAAELPAEVDAELKRLRATAEEVEGLRQQNKELLSSNDREAVLQSKAYQEQIQTPVNEIVETVKLLADAANVDAADIFTALQEKDIAKQDAMLDALKSKLNDRSYSRVVRFADDYRALEVKAGEMMQNAQSTIQSERDRQRQEAIRAKEERAGAYQAEVRGSFESFASRVPGLTDSTGQLTETAKALQAKSVAIDLDTLTEGDLGFMAFTAKAFPVLRNAYVKLEAENRTLKAGKSAGRGAPAVSTDSRGDDEDPNNPQSLSDRMKGREFSFSSSGVG